MDSLRCPTCLTILNNAKERRCPACRTRLRKRRGRPIILGDGARLTATSADLEWQARLEESYDERSPLRRQPTLDAGLGRTEAEPLEAILMAVPDAPVAPVPASAPAPIPTVRPAPWSVPPPPRRAPEPVVDLTAPEPVLDLVAEALVDQQSESPSTPSASSPLDGTMNEMLAELHRKARADGDT